MNTILLITILVVIFALVFDFINGFHDTANAIATSVSTRALKPAYSNLYGSNYELRRCNYVRWGSQSINKGYCRSFCLNAYDGDITGSVVILAALLSAITWNLVTWYYGIPSSSSHTLIGSVAGAAIAAAGFDVLNYAGFTKIIQALIILTIISVCSRVLDDVHL